MDFIIKGEKIIEIEDFEITGKYKILNRLKNFLPEAFYYWFHVSQIEKIKVLFKELLCLAEQKKFIL